MAMGGGGAAAGQGLEAMAQDPAALLHASGWAISHTFWIQDLRADQAAVAYRRGSLGLGLHLDLQEAPSVELRSADGRWLGSRTLRRDEASLTAAYGPGPWRLGLRGAVVQGDLDSLQGYAGVGAQFRPWGWLSLGGAMDLRQAVRPWRAAVEAAGPWRLRVTVGALQEDPDLRWGLGLEWEALRSWYLRVGWQRDARSADPADPASWSLGVALPLSQGELEYAWAQVGPLGQAHRLQWSTSFRSDLDGAAAAATPTELPRAPIRLVEATPTPSPLPSLSETPSLTPTGTPSPRPTATVQATATPSPSTPKNPVNLRFVIP